jgi:lipopolysaccharide assembly outer membrane protein LptD (OstA)
MFAKRLLYFLLTILCVQVVRAQRPAADTGRQQGRKIDILHADHGNFLNIDSSHQYVSMAGNVIAKQDKTLFYADSAILNQTDNSLEAFGNVHINDADSVHTYAQYLQYLGKEKKAFLKKKVRLTDGKGELTTEALEYDVNLKLGTYLTGGKLVNKKTVLTSTEGRYYGDTKDVIFNRKVVLLDPEYKVYTDTLQYNSNTEIATFTSPPASSAIAAGARSAPKTAISTFAINVASCISVP